jgi:Zn-dependent protease
MLRQFLEGRADAGEFASFVVAIVVSITVHEFAHAYVAWRAGDQTPKALGRVSLNPTDHLDLMGTVLILFGGFGWGKPVQVNPFNFSKPRRDDILVSLAGPASNLVMAALCAGLLHLLPGAAYHSSQGMALAVLLLMMVRLNVGLAVFNLMPVFPLDGHHIVRDILPDKLAARYAATIGGPPGILLLFVLVATPASAVLLVPRDAILHLLGLA